MHGTWTPATIQHQVDPANMRSSADRYRRNLLGRIGRPFRHCPSSTSIALHQRAEYQAAALQVARDTGTYLQLRDLDNLKGPKILASSTWHCSASRWCCEFHRWPMSVGLTWRLGGECKHYHLCNYSPERQTKLETSHELKTMRTTSPLRTVDENEAELWPTGLKSWTRT